jgi:hypothetical protein
MISGSIERIGALGLAPRDVLEALLASIPDAVYVIGDATVEAEEAITSLREIVDGVAPAILTARGLAAAVSSSTRRRHAAGRRRRRRPGWRRHPRRPRSPGDLRPRRGTGR